MFRNIIIGWSLAWVVFLAMAIIEVQYHPFYSGTVVIAVSPGVTSMVWSIVLLFLVIWAIGIATLMAVDYMRQS